MITIETQKPVYSNVGGKTKEEKKASRQRFLEKTQNVYSKGKDSGLLSGIENLFLGAGKGQAQGQTGVADKITGDQIPVGDSNEKKPMNPALKWGLIIGGVAVVGVAVWYFGFRNKSKTA